MGIDNRKKEEIDEKLKDIDNLPDEETPDTPVTPATPEDNDEDDEEEEEEEETPDTPATAADPNAEEDPDEEEEDNDEDEDPDKDKPSVTSATNGEPAKDKVDPNFKHLYGASTREAIILSEKNKSFINTVDEAANLPEPTEDELRAYAKEKGGDYDKLDPFAKSMLKDTFVNSVRFNKINSAVQKSKDVEAWGNKVDEFIKDPVTMTTYPQLEGRDRDFISFAMKPTHRGVDMAILVRSFSYDLKPIKKRARSMFQTGGGGTAPTTPKGELTEKDAEFLRKHDQKEYRRLIKAGKLAIKI
jgi:hypothetical protein